MPNLLSIARVAAAATAALAMLVAACSSASDGERTAASESALINVVRCTEGQIRECYGDTPPLTCTCVPYTIDLVTSAPTATTGSNVCGANDVPVPTFLQGLGCTLGTVIDGQPVWACPTSKVPSSLPNALGLTTSPAHGPCFLSDGSMATFAWTPDPIYCEMVIATSSLKSNSCVGPIDVTASFTFVIDALSLIKWTESVCYPNPRGGLTCSSPSGCAGGCPTPVGIVGP